MSANPKPLSLEVTQNYLQQEKWKNCRQKISRKMQAASAAALTFYIPGTCPLTLNGILLNKITTPCSKDFSQDPWSNDFSCCLYVYITWKRKENRTKNPSPQNPNTFAPGTLTTQSSSKNGECTKEDRQTDRPVQERLERKKLTIARDASEATGRQADPDSEKCDANAKT